MPGVRELVGSIVATQVGKAIGFGKPAVDKAAIGAKELLVTAIEVHIKLGQKKFVIAQVVAQTHQRPAEWRTVTRTINIGMMSQKLREESRTRSRQTC